MFSERVTFEIRAFAPWPASQSRCGLSSKESSLATSTRLRTSTDITVALDAVGKEDVDRVGGKGASLGEMLRAGVSVPPGFVVTTAAYEAFATELRLNEILEGLLGGVDVDDPDELARLAAQVQHVVLSSPVPSEIADEVRREYERLGEGPVAVRSSATSEDMADASFAGQYRTFLNVEGASNVVWAVRACWASLFEARAIFYRHENGIGPGDGAIAVPVQRMVPADVSGVMFTTDPSNADPNSLLIEAAYGLGEPVVAGELSPDAYTVERRGLRITRREHAVQPWMLVRDPAGDGFEAGSKRVMVAPELQRRPKLDEQQVVGLAELGLRLERQYGRPQDIEWAWADGLPFVLQSRPITTSLLGKPIDAGRNGHLPAIVSGAGASPGIATGPTRVILDASEIGQVRDGDVLVTPMTTPDFVPAMKRASAIVTDRGGRTCHAAIVSREMGLPCIVGTGNATVALSGVPLVTVNGADGKVHEGDVSVLLQPRPAVPTSTAPVATRTKLYVNLADPDAAARVAGRDVDGVGLLRAEFMIAHLGEHPRSMLESGRGDEFSRRLAEELERFADAFSPRPVVYRFSDFKTNEYRNLKGGEAFEPHEENPMIGYRGCARYLAEPELFALEVDALRIARRRFPNLWAMLPFVRTPSELRQVVVLLKEHGLERGPDFKLWMMAEVPSNVLLLDQFLDIGVDGVSIGSNDLTQLVLGVDRDNERLAESFDERDPAVQEAMRRIVEGCAERGVTVSICGQAPSVYPELARKLVEWGVTSVSVTPDMIEETRRNLHRAETSAA